MDVSSSVPGIPDHLQVAEYINLATFRRNGDAVCTPIWAASLGGSLYAFSEGDAGKIKRLRNFSRARIAECAFNGALLGVWHEAEAVIVTDPVEISDAYRALHSKYGWKMRALDTFSKLVGKYPKRAVIRIDATE